MISKIITVLVVAGIALAIWQGTGGNQEDFLQGIWTFFYRVVVFIADALTMAWNTVFTVK
jgi:hypothetical protein